MGDLVPLGLVVLALYFMIRFGAKLLALLFGSRNRAYRALAAKYRGRCESRGLVDPPTVTFFHRGSLVRVGLAPVVAGQTLPPRTRVVVRFAEGLPLRFELFPAARSAPAQMPRGTKLARLGDDEFDRSYVLQTNDAEVTRGVLVSDAVRSAIDALRGLCPPGGMLISVSPERMLSQVDRNMGNDVHGLDAAVRHTLLIYDWLLASVSRRLSEGVSVIHAGPAAAEDAGSPVCGVCGAPVLGAHVICTTCRTPCHRDCWGFVGGCSTFGCGGKNCAAVTATAAP